MAEERLQKIIAAAGIASRRKAEELIVTGHVSVNGRTITELGSKADVEADDIKVDGHRLSAPKSFLYIALNKPRNVVTTVHDPQGRETVMQFFKGFRERIYPVGRLDYASEGLLLLTNDGEFAAKLMAPSSHITKTYLVKANGILTTDQEEQFRRGIPVHGRRTAPAGLKLIKKNVNPWYEVRLVEGRQNQIRIMFKHFGRLVEKLKRVKIGFLELGTLKPGAYRTLTRSEVERFQKLLSAAGASDASGESQGPDRAPQATDSRTLRTPAFRPQAAPPQASGPKASEPKPFDPRKARNVARPPQPFAQQTPPGARNPSEPRPSAGDRRPAGPDSRKPFTASKPPAARKWAGPPRSDGAKSGARKPFVPRNAAESRARTPSEPRPSGSDRGPTGPDSRRPFAPSKPTAARKWAGPPRSDGSGKPSGPSQKPAGSGQRKWAGPRKPPTAGNRPAGKGPAPRRPGQRNRPGSGD